MRNVYQEQANDGTGGAAPAPASPAAPAPPAAAPAAPVPFDWNAAGLDASGMATITVKGWKGPADLLNSYVNLEKLAKAPEEQLIRLPKEMTPELMAPVYDRLGRPKTAAEYNLPAPEGQAPEYTKAISEAMHASGLSAKQALDLATANNAYIAAQRTRMATEYTAKVADETNALKLEWRDKYDSNVAIARQGAKTFGMDAAQISALEQAMGYAGVHKFLYNIGSKLGEAEFVQSGGRPSDFGGLSPDMARARVEQLKHEPTFVARWNSHDPVVSGEARAEIARLVKLANPGELTTT